MELIQSEKRKLIVRPEWADEPDRFVQRWVRPPERILVAVSGGADSVGLLAYLADAYGRGGDRLVVGHVDHSLRADSALDADFVREIAKKWGFLCCVRREDVPKRARERRLSQEAAARSVRYEALTEMAEKHGCRWIVTGHTLDDSAETVLMRMRSGAPWYEWTAIPRRRGRVLRPLLTIRRETLRKWVEEGDIPFREDPTNQDLRHARNRIRRYLLNKQDFWNVTKMQHVAEAGQALGQGLEIMRKLSKVMPIRFQDGESKSAIGLAIEGIFRYFSCLSFIPVEAAWRDLTGERDSRLPSALRRQINDMLRGRTPEAQIELPAGIRALRRGRVLWLLREHPAEVCRRIGMGEWSVPERNGILLLCEERPDDASITWMIPVRRDLADRELWLRSWRAGDRLKSAGRPMKKVADLLAERRRNPLERARTLVVTDADGPLWIVGGETAERALADSYTTQPMWIAWKGQNDRSDG
ncbi:tRNA lysidine(34) synthetase TilS [bacterium]|nr:tRNA lysidine(34) synthetase TilS [bacterium]MBU1985299.1 tRNA lysidine(34) synthetase TilS [bacterium]